jgi:hypothetical protein
MGAAENMCSGFKHRVDFSQESGCTAFPQFLSSGENEMPT